MSHVHGTGRDLTGDLAPAAGSFGARPATRTEPGNEGRAGRPVALFGKRLGIAAGTALVILSVAVGGALGATRSPGEPDWKKALDTRSQALDHKYGLGQQVRTLVTEATPGWLIALRLRSDMLDKQYGLGTEARTTASLAAPGWPTALIARSDALDRAYGLGRYANATP